MTEKKFIMPQVQMAAKGVRICFCENDLLIPTEHENEDKIH